MKLVGPFVHCASCRFHWAEIGGRYCGDCAPDLSLVEREIVDRFEAAGDPFPEPEQERDLLLDRINDWRQQIEHTACGPCENVWGELSVVIKQMRWVLEDHLPQWERDLLTGGA